MDQNRVLLPDDPPPKMDQNQVVPDEKIVIVKPCNSNNIATPITNQKCVNENDAVENNQSTTTTTIDAIPSKKPNTLEIKIQQSPPVKSVSFHSASSLSTEKPVDCLRCMINGTSLVKIKDSSRQYHRYFTLEDDLSAIRWMPSSKKAEKARISINMIHEIRTGKCTEALRSKETMGSFSDDCAFSIIHGESYGSLDLIASSSEEANIWVTGLSMLIAASKTDSLGESQRIRERWLKEVFDQADTDQKGELNIRETITLLKRLNSQVNAVRFKQRIMECEFDKTADERGKIDSTDFVNIFKETSTRPEIYFLLLRYSGKDYINCEDLQFFLEGEQGMVGITLTQCQEIINKFEPSEEARKNNRLLIDGFTQFLLSEDIMLATHKRVCQDMNQPLSHYFIAASHNTYLLADQLKGPSGIEGYTRALRLGGRYVKVDCWDGPCGPVVYHGNTLTSKVSLLSVLQTIRREAFVASQFPLFFHLENHCSIQQQDIVLTLLRDELGEALHVIDGGISDLSQLTPRKLMGKIIFTGKKLPSFFREVGDVTDEDDAAECVNSKDVLRKIALNRTLSDLISFPRVRFIDFPVCDNSHTFCDICSSNEAQASKLCRNEAEDFSAHNKHFLSYVYPNSTRVDSSNYNPIDFWRCGCQIVSMNFQTSGQMMDLYLGWFAQNGNCGYVLKPEGLRDPMVLSHPPGREGFLYTDPVTLQIKVISGQQLPRPKGASKKASTIDPYVVVQIFGISSDWGEGKTKSVSSDGHCPIFNESFRFDIAMPELALLRLVILDDEFIGDEFIGQNTIPLTCIQTGYHHISLMSNTGEPLQNATLFVHVSLTSKTGDQKCKRKRPNRPPVDMQVVGLKEVDNIFRGPLLAGLADAQQLRHDIEQAMMELCEDCGLSISSNIIQCLRVFVVRAANSAGVTSCEIVVTNGIPLPVLSGDVSLHLKKVSLSFEKVLMECKFVKENTDNVVQKLKACTTQATTIWQDFRATCISAGLKGKKAEKATENFLWNVNIVGYLTKILLAAKKESEAMLKQLENIAPAVVKLFENERNSKSVSSQKSGCSVLTADDIILPGSSCGSSMGASGNCSPEKRIPTSITISSSQGSDSGQQLKGILKKGHSPLPTPVPIPPAPPQPNEGPHEDGKVFQFFPPPTQSNNTLLPPDSNNDRASS